MKTTMPVRRVNFANDNEFAVLLWGSLGRSYRYIRKKSGLTNCQISYRLRRENIKLTDFRDGNNVASQIVEASVLRALERRLRQDLKAKALLPTPAINIKTTTTHVQPTQPPPTQ